MKKLILSMAFLCLSAPAFADSIPLPDSHAPLGVMGDHRHNEGEWMLSYRYGAMNMKGNRRGTDSVPTSDVLSQFMMAPEKMTMDMHMFGAMYGYSDDVTVMAMIPYIEKDMTIVNRIGARFKTSSSGFGDLKLTALYKLYDKVASSKPVRDSEKVHLNLGLSLPTGSTNERDDTPMVANQKLPYPMQLGSGTYDPILGITYVRHLNDWSWGGQAAATFRTGENDENYRLGHEYNMTAWGAKKLNNTVSISARLDGKKWSDIEGADADLNPMMTPTARTDLRGGERIDALVGLNFIAPEGAMKSQRLALEVGMPIYQDLDGPQLETDMRFMLGWQYAF